MKFFVDMIGEDSFDKIEEFTKDGHRVLNMIEDSHTTIALTTGLALGGGLELALSCDYRVGTEKTMLRFPETSIGSTWSRRHSACHTSLRDRGSALRCPRWELH